MRDEAPALPDKTHWLPLLGWTTGAVFFFYAWVWRVAPSVVVAELMRDFSVGAAVLGHLSATYFYGYAGMQIPVGLLLDRFGPRRLMAIAGLVCAGGGLLFSLGDSLTLITIGRFLVGAAAAFSLVGAMAVAGQWFRPNQFALLSGLAMAMGMAGGVAGQAPLRMTIEAWGWRASMFVLALGGLALAAAAWATVRDRWRGGGGLANALRGLKTVLSQAQIWLVALVGLGTSGPLLAFAGMWGVPFLESAYGLQRTSAATLTSLVIAGWGVGAPLFGWLSDRIGRRKAPLTAGLLLQTVALALLVHIPGLPIAAVAGLCVLIGFFGSAQIVCFALAKESQPSSLSGTAIGFVNAMVTGAGALFQPLVGLVLDLAWQGETALGSRVYDGDAYRIALSLLIACCVAGLFCLLGVRETYCRAQA